MIDARATWPRLLVAILLLAGPRVGGASSALAGTAGAGTGAQQAAGQTRFFLSGDGFLEIENAHTREKVSVRYRDASGGYSAQALAKIDDLFRSRGDDERTHVALRLIELIDYLQDRERPKTLFLVSGYRSEGYNGAIIARGGQAAQASMHTQGLAADLRFVGVDHRALWMRLRGLECCGAGYYKKSGFVHVDTGRPRFWEETTSRVGENLSKGNARIISRTDFDRYDDLVGLEATLHAITLRPLRVSSHARLVRDGGDDEVAELELEWPGAPQPDPDGCFTLTGDGRDAMRVASVEPSPAAARAGAAEPSRHAAEDRLRTRVVLQTCEPRLEATPRRIETNPIEASTAALQARHRLGGGG